MTGVYAAGRGTAAAELDRIALRGLRARGWHGVYAEERREGQEFVVDVVLGLDTAPAAANDELAHTVHYGELSQRLLGVVSGEPVQLIETLAERIARTCLAEPLVREVEVTVHKPEAPIPEVTFEDVSVTIRRPRFAP
ncbi:dihydroneopterin aldolase [Lipingzhangella sp. LS1_29]|uniref:7,8-dihydroneopterin aldolase n=1 Tax=Lipingzhangella rawalii TaxID=2055835 RepID=A0ABU2H9F2_9ACTN|nr:dihydroneopterin aldolase [Lipingzhangella rawalii]MDS1271918.1 dihydroneopterin aldolase [Lipingzhangella rawalii]